MFSEQPKKLDRQRFSDYSLQDKRRKISNLRQKNQLMKDGVFVVAQPHPKCKAYSKIPQCRFMLKPKDKMNAVYMQIWKKKMTIDPKLQKYSLFMFASNQLINPQHTVEQMYNKYRNFNDNVLYIYFGEVQAF